MASFGEELRRERELREIDLREVSEATKVALRYLHALERNDFEHLPGGVFNRGFVRAYAQYIGVDPEAMVNAYLLEEQAQKGTTEGTPSGLLRGDRRRPGAEPRPRATSETARAAPGARRLWIVIVAVVGAALLAAGLWWAAGHYGWLESGASAPNSPAVPSGEGPR